MQRRRQRRRHQHAETERHTYSQTDTLITTLRSFLPGTEYYDFLARRFSAVSPDVKEVWFLLKNLFC